jgi:hypothetical protein
VADQRPAAPVLADEREEPVLDLVPWVAAEALGKIAPGTPKADQAMRALIDSLGYENRRDLIESIRALAEFGPAAAIPCLETLQRSRDADVNEAASQALERNKPTR